MVNYNNLLQLLHPQTEMVIADVMLGQFQHSYICMHTCMVNDFQVILSYCEKSSYHTAGG